ncbi:MAG: zf-HC2 domain-containing protein [Burkholderiales bacterium]|nr:zf-HC2 domain-containing protein [Burkholderiales bacterium]
MNARACNAPIAFSALVDYWFGELDEAEEARIEEHLLGCGDCADRLEELAAIASGVRALVRDGSAHAVVPAAFVEQLAESGLRLREYRPPPNGGVNCTISPDDDIVVARLVAHLEGVQRLDLVVRSEGGEPDRIQNIPFDAADTEIVILPSTKLLRTLPQCRQVMQLVAVDDAGDRVIADYTFNHTPYAPHG